MKKSHLFLVIALISLMGLTGCGTLFDLTDMFGKDPTGMDGVHIYGGVRQDILLMETGKAGWALVLDLPFSLVLDTALLPLTVPCELLAPDRPKHPTEAKWDFVKVGMKFSAAKRVLAGRPYFEDPSANWGRAAKQGEELHAFPLGSTSGLVLYIDKNSNTVRSIEICSHLDDPEADRVWKKVEAYRVTQN